MDSKPWWMGGKHLLLLFEVEEPLGPCKCLRQMIAMDVIVRNVAEANVATRLHKLIGNCFLLFDCTFIPLGEVNDGDGRSCFRHIVARETLLHGYLGKMEKDGETRLQLHEIEDHEVKDSPLGARMRTSPVIIKRQ